MFLILLSFIKLGSESQIPVFKQIQSNTHVWVWGFFFLGGGEGGGGAACAEAKIWRYSFFSEKKKLYKALHSVQFLASFISFNFKILSYLACGEKIIRLASKNSVKLGEKSVSDF